jgi:hypothetical protein
MSGHDMVGLFSNAKSIWKTLCRLVINSLMWTGN